MTLMVGVVNFVASWVVVTWTWASVVLLWAGIFHFGSPRVLDSLRALCAEFRPFYWPAVCVEIAVHIATGRTLTFWGFISDASLVLNWWLLKDAGGDDDRWKRRRTKAATKVKALASGRLTVVPMGAS